MARIVSGSRPNIAALSARWREAERAWRKAVAAHGFNLYSDKAEGRMIGRGKSAKPDELRQLFNARCEALEATYLQKQGMLL